MNTNTNTPTTTTVNDPMLAAMLEQYANNNKPSYTSEVKYDEKNYFGTFLDKNATSAIKRVRILPTKDNSTPFVEMTGHKAQVEGQWKIFACLEAEKGEACPFCEAREALLATGDATDKELAKEYGKRKMYVVKVIDRDNEADGVKFWRFNHDYRKTGVLDKIFGVLQIGKNITDVNTGRDLQITIARDQNNRPVIQSIINFDPSPLSTDAAQAQAWINDEKTWTDVYSIKNYEYLEIVVKGGVPVYDKVNKCYVDKRLLKEGAAGTEEKLDSELTIGAQNVKPNVVPAGNVTTPVATTTVAQPAAATGADDEDDLPF
jgi:hypothetical protein